MKRFVLEVKVMKRFVLSAIVLLLAAGLVFGDVLDPEYFRNFVPEMSLRVYTSDSEDNTLELYMDMAGEGDLSYTIRDKTSGRIVYSGSDVSIFYFQTTVIETWKYAVPKSGKSLNYEIIASFDTAGGGRITQTKNVTIRNVRGVVNVIITD